MSYSYLAGPYSHKDTQMRAWRYKRHRRVHDDLMLKGELVFSPVLVGHEFEHRDPKHRRSHEFWLRYSLTFLARASRMYVLTLPGWEDSVGLGREVKLCADLGIPLIVYDIGDNCEDVISIDVFGHFGVQSKHPSRL